ncbi:MAG: YihY/virulence factor BrkB family protein [Methyloligellaceae bacterium]
MKTFWYALVRVINENGMGLASSVAFSFMLSIFPMIVFSASLIAFIGNEVLIGDILSGFEVFFPADITQILLPEIKKVLNTQRVDLLTVGGLLMLFFASTGTQSLRGALNRAYEVRENRSIIWLIIHSFLFVIQFTFVLSVITTAVFSATILAQQLAPAIDGTVDMALAIKVGSYVVAVIVMLIELFIIHAFLPAGRRTLGEIWPGAFVSIILWLLCAVGYSFYVSIANYTELYAGLSRFIIVLIFFQVTAMIIIIGAGVNRARIIARQQ